VWIWDMVELDFMAMDMDMDINQLTSSVDQRLISSGKVYRTAGQQEWYAAFDMGENGMYENECSARLYE